MTYRVCVCAQFRPRNKTKQSKRVSTIQKQAYSQRAPPHHSKQPSQQSQQSQQSHLLQPHHLASAKTRRGSTPDPDRAPEHAWALRLRSLLPCIAAAPCLGRSR
ncbi:hypothetical protein P171DRAFT_432073 [Karstenula rhodostoma CBS 690.94]|uniref:Uncharacterized protein n=1 Tax=Karstenula rhodostoma CBS 690.94 TaxID=1392251 RepID=A0A9P4UB85_9PLEO|nr:hypothetical protein P171DRAFT_432073 [Karstenula rhodostoma CBS 690.94]